MGVVYKAEDSRLKRSVAIKFLPNHIAKNDEESKRFEVEAQAAASLNHPNITQIYAIEEVDGELFISMEFVEGRELADIIKNKPLPIRDAVDIAYQLAEGLKAAHDRGVIHRDIKSSNVMITPEGLVKIMDFGLAQISGGIHVTKIGSTLGTASYMSPEQAIGEKMDERTDIWSVGVVLYEMLTQNLPFKGAYEQAVIYSILNEEPDPIISVRDDVPEMLQGIVQKLLKKEAKERYQSMQELISDLKKLSAIISGGVTKSGVRDFLKRAAFTSKEETSIQVEAERRNITSLYCSLQFIDETHDEVDPEDLSEIMPQCLEILDKVIKRYSGFVSSNSADGISVCFGFPVAHEDEAKRALLTAIGVREGIESFSSKMQKDKHISINVRMSLHTGLVMIKDFGGGVNLDDIEIVGETPGIAFHLQAHTEPNSIVVTEATFKLIENFFEYRELGEHKIKGSGKPLKIFQVFNQSAVKGRFDVLTEKGLSPLVGRSKELHLLIDSWENTLESMGQVIVLEGEAGIGKSRLVQEIKEHIQKTPGNWLIELFCSPYFQGTALRPIIELFESSVLEFEDDFSAEDKLNKLEGFLVQYGLALSEAVPLFCSLLSIPMGTKYNSLALTPEAQKNKIIETLINLLLSRAAQQPVLLIADDLHWADPTTLELLKRVIEQISIYKVLIIFTYRPGFSEPWDKNSNITKISLNRLPQKEIDNLVTRVAKGKTLPPLVIEQIKKKTDGVPLFVEELTKMVLESNLLIENKDRYELKDELTTLAIPATLQDSLMARLDKMGSSKEIAQLGATIGREFSLDLISNISELNKEDLTRALGNLVHAEILYHRSLLGKESYIFKHALIQDVAYESLLKSKRQTIHKKIVSILEEKFSEMTETEPELFARHYTSAGIYDKAIAFWHKAGFKELQRSYNFEAINLLTNGLKLLEKLPDSPEKNQTELLLQATLGPAVIATKGFGASEVGAIFSRSAELCKMIGDTPHLFPSIWGQWVYNLVQANLKTAVNLSSEMLKMGEQYSQTAMLVEGNWTMGNNLFWLGDFENSAKHLESAVSLYDPSKHHAHAYIFGQDPQVAAKCYLSYTSWYLGFPDTALKLTDEVLKIANRLNHPFSIGWALAFGMMVAGFRRDADLTLQRTKATIDYCQKQSYPFWISASMVWLGWAMTERGNFAEGISTMRQGLSIFDAIGSNVVQPLFMGILAEVLGDNGNLDEAFDIVDRAFQKAQVQEEKASEIDLYRIKGKLLLKQSKANVELSEKYLNDGLAMANKLNAKSRKLQAAIELSSLWKDIGKKEHARKLLSDVCNSFDEGQTTRDFVLANQLLKELS